MWALVVAGDAPGRRSGTPDPSARSGGRAGAPSRCCRGGPRGPDPPRGGDPRPRGQGAHPRVKPRPDPVPFPAGRDAITREPDSSQPRLLTPSSRLVLAALLAIGLLLVWRGTHHPAVAAGPPRLAVLPFENLGDSGDAYFAGGVTDEVRGKLAAMPGLEVVASLSSNDYRANGRRLPDDRAGAGGELPAGREDPLALREPAGSEPGAGEPGADPAAARRCAGDPLAAADRCRAHRRLCGPGRHRRPRWPTRSAWRWATAPDAS